MKLFYLLFCLVLIDTSIGFSQNVGIGTTNPNPAAKLEVQSTNSGVLIPRLTTAQKNSIPSPPAGLIVYDNTLSRFSFFDGAKWTDIKGTGTEDSIWSSYVSNSELNVFNAIGQHFYLAGPPMQSIGSSGNIDGVLQLEHGSGGPLSTTTFLLSLDGNGIQARTKSGSVFAPPVDANLLLDRFGGNVGLGTGFPNKAKLEVNGFVGNTVGLFARTNGTSQGIALVADWPGLFFNSYFNGSPRAMSNTGFAGIVNFDPDNGNIIFGVSPQQNSSAGQSISLPEMMRITKDGRVGIGTSNPAYPLSVNGQIQAKEIRVETGWSDYVFDKKYKLLSLREVEIYIQQHQHLPGIPSAEEIVKNGLPVADVSTKMMAKIEELTLYVIELEKRIKEDEKLLNQSKPERKINKTSQHH